MKWRYLLNDADYEDVLKLVLIVALKTKKDVQCTWKETRLLGAIHIYTRIYKYIKFNVNVFMIVTHQGKMILQCINLFK